MLAVAAHDAFGQDSSPSDESNKPSPRAAPAGILTSAEQQALSGVATAYARGEAAASLGVLSSLLSKWDQAKIAAADALFEENGLPPLARQLAEARLAELKLNPQRNTARLSPREALLVLPELRKELESILSSAKDHPVMREPLPRPQTPEEYEDLFWKAHVLDNQFRNASMIAGYMTQLAGRISRRDLARLDEAQKAAAEADYEAIAKEVEAAQRDLAERLIEMRADRLAMATKWLGEFHVSKRKFLAAFAWQLDAALLEEAYRSAKPQRLGKNEEAAPRFVRERLNVPDFFTRVGADAKEAKRLAGDLTTKANLLYKGLHWWYRGRYGMGPFAYGLVKHPAAIHSEEGQLGLFMPREAPTPNDPGELESGETPIPYYDRRHHYWWAWEDRRMARSGFSDRSQTTTREFW
jgi:hypothetical protein